MTETPPPPPGYPPPPPSGYPPQQPAGQAPKNYLVWSIVSLFFCLIPGIVAVVFSAQVNGLWAQGRYADAQKASSRAKTWATVAIVLGLIVVVINLITYVSGGYNADTNAAMLAAMF